MKTNRYRSFYGIKSVVFTKSAISIFTQLKISKAITLLCQQLTSLWTLFVLSLQ